MKLLNIINFGIQKILKLLIFNNFQPDWFKVYIGR